MELETATEKSMQDISNDIESKLFGTREGEPEESAEDAVLEGDESLPEEDDVDSVDDEGSEDEVEDSENDELTEEEQSLADYLGIDEDKLVQDEDGRWLYSATIDGETKNVPLSELTKSFQLQGHVNNKSIALENQRKEFQEQQTQVANELKQRVEGVLQINDILEKELIGEFNSIDWDKLKAQDPNRWAVMRQEYGEKAQRIESARSLATQEAQRLQEEQAQQQQQAFQEHLQAERERMLASNPEWVDETVLTKDMGVLKDFVKTTYGFSDEDTNLVTDHRLIGLIQDAHKFRSGEKARKGAEQKKEKLVPKFQKSKATAAKSSQLSQARAVKAKRARVKQTGSTEDVANLLIDRM